MKKNLSTDIQVSELFFLLIEFTKRKEGRILVWFHFS